MPFDGNPKQFVKPDVFSLEGLASWLETQDGETEYDYGSIHDCLLCRYFRAHGVRAYSVNPKGYRLSLGGRLVPYPITLNTAVNIRPADFESDMISYAAALDRCRALIAECK